MLGFMSQKLVSVTYKRFTKDEPFDSTFWSKAYGFKQEAAEDAETNRQASRPEEIS